MKFVKLIKQIGGKIVSFSPLTSIETIVDEKGNRLKDIILQKSDLKTIFKNSIVGKGDLGTTLDDAIGGSDGILSAQEVKTIVEILTAAIVEKDEQIEVLSQQILDLSHKASEQEKVIANALAELSKK